MSGNTFGNKFKLTTFGESHGAAIGGIIDGCPSNVVLDLDAVQLELDRRKPGQSKLVTQRKEADEVVSRLSRKYSKEIDFEQKSQTEKEDFLFRVSLVELARWQKN